MIKTGYHLKGISPLLHARHEGPHGLLSSTPTVTEVSCAGLLPTLSPGLPRLLITREPDGLVVDHCSLARLLRVQYMRLIQQSTCK